MAGQQAVVVAVGGTMMTLDFFTTWLVQALPVDRLSQAVGAAVAEQDADGVAAMGHSPAGVCGDPGTFSSIACALS
jgi:hypothetical protein